MSAAAKKNEEFLDKDAEILRLIEDRRSMPKEEKQRLKDLSKSLKKCIREKKEWRDSKTLKESLKSSKVSEISRDQNSKEENTHHKNKERKKRMHHISKRNCRCFWRILHKTIRGQRKR